jgi:hypothetical protein
MPSGATTGADGMPGVSIGPAGAGTVFSIHCLLDNGIANRGKVDELSTPTTVRECRP